MVAKILFLFLFFLIGTPLALAQTGSADLHLLAQNLVWRGLLHYFDASESEIINEEFFLSPAGREDPEQELRATIKAFNENTIIKGVIPQTAYCAFPARLEWLEKQGFSFPHQECKDQNEFIQNISPKSLTLVFSSAYPNNPASLFGHTMIRVNQGKNDPLLDYGVNYAARVPPGETGIKYVVKGLLGMYPGSFGISPFYQKVLEYNEAESRDLWEYDMTFTETESLFWVKHLWEVRFLADFHYAFLNRNCSYQIMRSLEILRPGTPGWIPSNFFYTLPGETIRNLKIAQPDLFGEIHFRPSHFKILKNRYNFLSSEQKADFKNARLHPETIPNEKDPYVLEALNSYYEYIKIQQQENAETTIKERLRIIRVTRARLGGVTDFPVISTQGRTNQPDLAHGTRRIALTSYAGNHQSSEVGIRGRLGLHELLDRDNGYEANFGVTGAEVELSWLTHPNGQNHLWLRRVNLFDLVSLQPIGTGQYPVSWKIFSGWNPLMEPSALGEGNDFQMGGGAGFTLEPLVDHLWVGSFVNVSSQISGALPHKKWASLSFDPYVLYRASERLKTKLTFVGENDFEFSSRLATRASLEVSWSIGKMWEIRLSDTQAFSSYVEHESLNEFGSELGWFF